MPRHPVGQRLRGFVGLPVVVLLLLLTQAGQAQPTNALQFFKNYFVTGDYLVAGVGLRGTGVSGIATGDIHFSGTNVVPPDADIMAAFLIWESVVTGQTAHATSGAAFRGHDISSIAVELNPSGASPCWSPGVANSGRRMKTYRADVLQFMGQKTDDTGQPTGKRLVNDVDLDAAGLPPNTVQLPDAGAGDVVPSTAGASLLIVYRDPNAPLKGIVVYNGGFSLNNANQPFNLNVQGFFEASTVAPQARMSHIVGNGPTHFGEQVVVNGGVVAINPFVGADGPAAGPAWDTWTLPTPLPIAGDAASVNVAVNRREHTSTDCLSWGAVVVSTTVQDTDSDGLLDVWETTSGLTDPDGTPLPDLPAMGADKNVQDLFIELGYMASTNGYNTPFGPVTAHSHQPSVGLLSYVATLFRNAGPRPGIPCPNGFCPINVHWDVGRAYTGVIPSVSQCKSNWTPACAIIAPTLARGGERIEETACTAPCNFPDFPGTVGWKTGFQVLRDQPLNYPDEASCVAAGALCRRRFDSNRFHTFKYGLIAHATGVPREDDPATPYDETRAPRSISGVADGGNGGGDFMVTLGFWGNNFLGSDFVQIGTLAHEIGHTMALRHGGARPTAADPAVNCRPNYESVMNYLFQVRGLTTPTGPIIAFSRQRLANLDEGGLTQSAITDLDAAAPANAMAYPTRWLAPKAGSLLDLLIDTTPATRHCNGTPLTAADTVAMIRVDATTTGAMDWNANGFFAPPDPAVLSQDINFNGKTDDPARDGTFKGFNDWQHMDLRQTASRRNKNGLSLEIDYTDVSGDEQPSFGNEQPSFGDEQPAFGDEQPSFGDEQPSFGDDLDFETATSVAIPPRFLNFTTTNQAIVLRWDPPAAGDATQYQVWRATGPIGPTNLPTKIFSTVQLNPPRTFSDTNTQPGVTYTYFVTAIVDGKQSGPSNIITARR